MSDALRDAMVAALSAGRERYARAKDKPGQLDLFGGGERRSSKVQKKVDWEESKHPRDAEGKFSTTEGSGKKSRTKPDKQSDSSSQPKKVVQDKIGQKSDKSDSRAEWTEHEGSLALRISGSKYVAVAANGQKDSKNFAVYDTDEDSYEPVEYLPASEVHQWLERNAGDASTESTDEPDVSTEEEEIDTTEEEENAGETESEEAADTGVDTHGSEEDSAVDDSRAESGSALGETDGAGSSAPDQARDSNSKGLANSLLNELADGQHRSLTDLHEHARQAHGVDQEYDRFDPLGHPVNATLKELADSRRVSVHNPRFGDPSFWMSDEQQEQHRADSADDPADEDIGGSTAEESGESSDTGTGSDADAESPEDTDDGDDEAEGDAEGELSETQSSLFDLPETRDEAKKRTETEFDENYAFARKSSIANAGEDLLGSARHRRNEWRNLEDAEADGTAEEMVTRKNLVKADPHDFVSIIDENPEHALSAAAMALALRKFPAKPGPKSKRAAARTKEDEKKKDRRQFVESYQHLKAFAEETARTESDPDEAITRFKNEVSNTVKKLRGQSGNGYAAQYSATDRYNSTANLLVDTFKAMGTARYGQKTSVFSQMNDLRSRLSDSIDHDQVEVAKRIAEGDGVAKAMGQKGESRRSFDPAQFYGAEAVRDGGRDIEGDANSLTERLTESVGLRGVQFGNSVTDQEREHHTLKASEALADLADMTGLDDEDISIGGTLGLAIGARGRAGALAHYEPDSKVINLTRKGGIGSLAHEWGHFFDHAMGEFKGFTSDTHHRDESVEFKDGRHQRVDIPDEHGIRAAYKGLYEAMRPFQKRLDRHLSELRQQGWMSAKKVKYWGSKVETFARCFERHIQEKMESLDRDNTYLVALHKKSESVNNFWPNADEVKEMAPHFEAIFEAFRKRKASSPDKYSMKLMLDAARATDTSPTESQKKAGNYRKGSFWHWGYEIAIENPKGSKRSGNGWSVTMPCHYGYIRRTEGNDGDQVDVFIGSNLDSEAVFVINQQTQSGRFDEHKCVLGCCSEKEARKLYLSCYTPGWSGLGSIVSMTKRQFQSWLAGGKKSNAAMDRYAGLFDESKHPRDHGKFAKKPGIAGQQMSLLDGDEPAGTQKTLFNVVRPTSKKQMAAKIQASLLEKIEDDLKASKKESLGGQKDLFSRISSGMNRFLMNQYAVDRYELAPQPTVRPKKRTEKPKQEAASQKKNRQPGDGTPGWQKVGGSHVFVDGDGKITKGCPGLKGEYVQDIIDESHDSRDVREARQAHAKAEGLTGEEYTAKHRRKHSTQKAQNQHANAKEAARQHGVAAHKVLATMPEAHSVNASLDADVESARQRARQMTGLNAGRIAKIENNYRDHSTVEGFEANARDFAAERPDLFDKDAHDTPAKVWDFIREGQQDRQSERSLETAHAAAEMLKRRPQPAAEQSDESWGGSEFEDDSFDFGQPTTQGQLAGAIVEGIGDWSDEAPF